MEGSAWIKFVAALLSLKYIKSLIERLTGEFKGAVGGLPGPWLKKKDIRS